MNWTRLKELIGHASLQGGLDMVTTHCQSIHSFLTLFTIDAVFVNRVNQAVVLAENLAGGGSHCGG